VNAIGKKSSNVFFFPKLSLNLICLGPSAVLVDKVKSGALVPTVSGINNPPVLSSEGKIHYKIDNSVVKEFAAISATD
jgi:hypothetical protein